jgi:hypothetical protein
MIGHHQFKDRFARAQDFFGIGNDLHAGFDRTDAGSGENARAGVNDAEAADADGRLVLQMAKRGNVDAVDACGIEDCRAGRYTDELAVDSDVDHSGRYQGSCHFKDIRDQLSAFSKEENNLSASRRAWILLPRQSSSQHSVLRYQ